MAGRAIALLLLFSLTAMSVASTCEKSERGNQEEHHHPDRSANDGTRHDAFEASKERGWMPLRPSNEAADQGTHDCSSKLVHGGETCLTRRSLAAACSSTGATHTK